MDIDVRIGTESLTVHIENPHSFDVSQAIKDIVNSGIKLGVDLPLVEIEKLIPKMVRGVSRCENGCPANAKSLVREGFNGFNLSYIEGGILKAVYALEDGEPLEIKVFPEFD